MAHNTHSPGGGHSSETSHPIDMINQSMMHPFEATDKARLGLTLREREQTCDF
jgi:hypothetical protein